MPHRLLQLVAFDMEGCLTDEPTVWEIMHRKLGTWESHGLPYWNRYRAGELGYDEFARMDVAAWTGAPAALLDEAACEVPLMPGCAELLGALRQAGVRVAVITNGLDCVAGRFRQLFGAEYLCANGISARDGRLTGEIEIRVSYAGKGRMLAGLMRALSLRRSQVAAVGDSPSDIEMFRAAAIGVAFRPTDPSVAQAATHVVKEKNLRLLGRILLA